MTNGDSAGLALPERRAPVYGTPVGPQMVSGAVTKRPGLGEVKEEGEMSNVQQGGRGSRSERDAQVSLSDEDAEVEPPPAARGASASDDAALARAQAGLLLRQGNGVGADGPRGKRGSAVGISKREEESMSVNQKLISWLVLHQAPSDEACSSVEWLRRQYDANIVGALHHKIEVVVGAKQGAEQQPEVLLLALWPDDAPAVAGDLRGRYERVLDGFLNQAKKNRQENAALAFEVRLQFLPPPAHGKNRREVGRKVCTKWGYAYMGVFDTAQRTRAIKAMLLQLKEEQDAAEVERGAPSPPAAPEPVAPTRPPVRELVRRLGSRGVSQSASKLIPAWRKEALV